MQKPTRGHSRSARAEPEPENISWTIRMPRAMAQALRARAEVLTKRGGGRWSGQLVILSVLTKAQQEWAKEETGSDE